MKKSLQIKFENTIPDELGILIQKSNSGWEKAKKSMALQLLNNIINGSPKEKVTPPIKTGFLRGSGSVFVGGELIGDTTGQYPKGKPNRDYSGKEEEITVGFDASYAAKLHEGNWNPGEASRRAGDTGNKFVEKHLKADGEELMEIAKNIIKKELNL